MINIPIDKLLFLDIETVGVEKDWDSLKKNNEPLSFLFNLKTILIGFKKDFLRMQTNQYQKCLSISLLLYQNSIELFV
jgi:hypothetical protein